MTAPVLSPVVFVHGLWLHASSWWLWIDAFRDAGYEASAPGWPGEMSTVAQTRAHSDAIVDAGFDDLVQYYAGAVDGMTPPPVLVGHAFGGRLVHRLVELGLAGGGIAIDAANGSPQRGTGADGGPSQLDSSAFAALYGDAITRDESDQLHQAWAIPASQAAVADAGARAGSRRLETSLQRPFLVILGDPEQDTLDPPLSNGTDVRRFSDRGGSLTIDSGWLEVAESCLAWLDAQEL